MLPSMPDSGGSASPRRLRYNVAASLDGFIATPEGGYDWIVADDSIDFDALFAEFDCFVLGRKTYEVMLAQREANPLRGRELLVASRTLDQAAHPDVCVVAEGIEARVAELKARPGRDIWLFGGGELAGQLLDAGLVDSVEVAVMPVLLREGLPLLPPGRTVRLKLESARSLAGSGIQMLSYRPLPAS